MPTQDIHQAACHCGAVQFEVTLQGGLDSARRCTCSYCAMRGAVALTAPLDGLKIVSGQEVLKLYQFNTKTAEHYFCSVCGIYTHHKRRSNPNEYGVNAACLAGVSPFDFDQVIVNNGVQHPTDYPDADQIAGVLRFDRN
ncbi:GFA family protein [Loktanella sp. S4079]|uniref:GFA family protein n=1 Tax=Loktanella sp. S4079 TaxID=579483 RepID=UPI0005FA6640|nr:GFA family protein [Loktanella sp. S4079]KJZ20565.1 aldehyde-activating protein [Loktanella sp. S4079]